MPAIRRFADERRQVNLAVSLHAVDDDLRSSMMPVNKKYNVEELLDACHYYIDMTGRRLTFEWALINGVNDTPEQARKAIAKIKRYVVSCQCHPPQSDVRLCGKSDHP